MKESLRIENFGPIKCVDIKDVKPFMVFIGKSATGKSCILKLLALFRYIFKLTNIRSYFHHSRITRSPFRVDFKSLVKRNGLVEMFSPETRIVYTCQGDSGNTYSIAYEHKKLSKLPDVAQEDLLFLKGVFVAETRGVLSYWIGSGLPESKLGFYFQETAEIFSEASEAEGEVEIPGLEVKFQVGKAKNGKKIYKVVPDSTEWESFRFTDASSGMQSTIPLAVIVKYMADKFDFDNAFNRSVLDYMVRNERLKEFRPVAGIEGFKRRVAVHIEEPELSLDPFRQTLLAEFLTDTLFHNHKQDRQCSLMFTTHTPYLADYVNVLMSKWENDNSTGVDPALVDVWLLDENGTATSVMVTDDHGRPVVNTDFLAARIEESYAQYEQLRH